MDGKFHTNSSSRARTLLRRSGWLLSGLAVVGTAVLFRWNAPAEPVSAEPPRGGVRQATALERTKLPAPTPAPNTPQSPEEKGPKVVAVVNSEAISRQQLADECLLHYGTEVLESIVNRTLILVSCQRHNIVVTDQEIDAEIERMAAKFKIGKEQWVKLLQKERGISYDRYARDIIWPTLALRELAKDHLQITKQEIDDAFESEFGPGVKVRLIALESPEKAREIHAEALAHPEDFGALAKNHSQDVNSASAYGLIQPIRRHLGDPQLEAAAFALKKGEISPIVQVGNLHVFVKCEEHLPATKVDRSKVEQHLYDALRERKLRNAASDVFKKLQDEAQVEVVYGDPTKSKQYPGVAAVINGHKIPVRDLAEECIERYGTDVLDGTINRLIIEQALRKRQTKVTDADIESEIARAALAMGKEDANGQPDVAGWLEYVTSQEGITRAVYVRDEVWPSAALKKLVGTAVKVTQEDMKRGYEANYGPKIRCRAIVMNNQRRAQEVWDEAREALTLSREEALKKFGDLAAEHSIEVGSRSLRGEVPPIQKFGGQPLLEEEAFKLGPDNPLSAIVQVGGTYVILFYEGRTKPIDTSFSEVQKLIYADIKEKKMRVAMANAFENLRESSQVDNFLTGDIHAPKRDLPDAPEAQVDPNVPRPRVLKR